MPASGYVKDKLRSNATNAVINATLIRDCVHITDVPLTDDARSGGRGGYGDRASLAKQNMYLKSLAMNLEFHKVTCVMLSHQGIGRIDNLVGLPSLTKLHLDNNNIREIENLAHLTKLEWLDLSFNQITEIKGLDTLVELRDLSLYSNLIRTVAGLDTLSKLQCLSLGVNQIDSLDDTARYLHRLRALRMLTLSGNQISAQKVYKNRIIAFVGENLRYLDSRLVLPKEHRDASDDQNEALSGVVDADIKAKAAADERAASEKEVAEAALRNCIVPSSLISDLDAIRIDGINPLGVLASDVLRERCKDAIDKFEQITTRAQEFYQQASELYFKKKADQEGFAASLRWYSDKTDDECKSLIADFEHSMKLEIPYGLRAQPNLDTYDDDAIHALRELLADLKDDLMEKEADQFDAFASAMSVYEDKLKENYEKVGKDLISSRFEEFRRIEKDYLDAVKSCLATWFEEKSRNEATALTNIPRDLTRILDSKDECQKAMNDIGDARIKLLDEIEDSLKKNEDAQWRALLEDAQATEQTRSRARIAEIIAYVKRQEEHLNQWEAAVDAMSA